MRDYLKNAEKDDYITAKQVFNGILIDEAEENNNDITLSWSVRVRHYAKQDRNHGDISTAGLSANDSALKE